MLGGNFDTKEFQVASGNGFGSSRGSGNAVETGSSFPMKLAGTCYAWDDRDSYDFLELWEGKKRRWQTAGQTPAEALEAQRRKRNELVG